jgi:hypothetical protein
VAGTMIRRAMGVSAAAIAEQRCRAAR